MPWVNAMFEESRITLQQDRVTTHMANLVQEWCKRNMVGLKELWPPFSPDLNPMDFAIWSILENKACSSNHQSVKALKHRLKTCWDEIFRKNHTASCSQIPDKLRSVVKAREGVSKNNCRFYFLGLFYVFLKIAFHFFYVNVLNICLHLV